MPLDDIAGGLISGVFRVIAHILVDVVLELLIKGPGYAICRIFRTDPDPDAGVVVFVGLLFWAIVGVIIYVAYVQVVSARAS
jgi:hypothetical protein